MIWIGENNNEKTMLTEDYWRAIYILLRKQGIIKDKDIDLLAMSETEIAQVIYKATHNRYKAKLIEHRYTIETPWGEPREHFNNLEHAKSRLGQYIATEKRLGGFEPFYWHIWDNVKGSVVHVNYYDMDE